MDCSLNVLNKDAAADVRVGVRRGVVVHVEQAVILVLVIVPAGVQARVGSVEVPVIRDAGNMRETFVCCADDPKN